MISIFPMMASVNTQAFSALACRSAFHHADADKHQWRLQTAVP
jgi:hypothetical protein